MSRRDGFDKLAAVIWPETAPPFIVEPGSPALEVMAKAVPPEGYLLTGAARGTGKRADGVWNSLLVIDKAGAIVAQLRQGSSGSAGRIHPVPQAARAGVGLHRPRLVRRGASSAPRLRLPGLPSFSPVICYEVIFPAAVTGPGERPRWLLNVTNDAWFGLSSGPYQHLASSRLRAVEEGLPMIRAANTGVSAVIDAYGRVLASLDMMREGSSTTASRPPREPTPYGRWGDGTLLALLGLAGLLLVAMARFTSSEITTNSSR